MTASIEPDLGAEREVDLRRYGRLLLARWWVIAVGLVAGVIVGLILAFSGGSVWRAEALISLGHPYSPAGSAPVASYATSPDAVAQILDTESVLRRAAAQSSVPVSRLRAHVWSGPANAEGTQDKGPLLGIRVQGKKPAQVEAAANALAQIVIRKTTAPYVGIKIRKIKTHLASIQKRIDIQQGVVNQLQQQANNKSLTPFERLVISNQLNGASQLLGGLLDSQVAQQQLLAFSQQIESATIVAKAEPIKTTARSKRTSMLVGGLIGLILGLLVASLWEPLSRRVQRR